MDKHPIGDLMSTTMQKIKEMIDVNTIVGQPIITEGATIIPVSKVSLGFASGGSDFGPAQKNEGQDKSFGGGSGAGVSISPVAFLIVKGDSVKLLPVAPPPTTTIDRAVELIPEIFDKVTQLVNKDKDKEIFQASYYDHPQLHG